MNRPVARFAVLLLTLAFAACQRDSTAPEGATSTVSVRAYVDANGSGTFDTGDTPIAGATVQLARAGADTLSATTGSDGVATFADVAAGSYTARISGNAPQGSVLATAALPVVIAPVAGDNVTAEFRYVFNPGTISGTLFRDNNGNGTLDSGDTPAAGLTVRAFKGTDTTATAVATQTTDENGAYTFSGLRPGSYTILVTPFPTIQIVGGNSQTATVTASQATTADFRFTGSLVIPISEARTKNPADKAVVAVRGTVVANLGTYNARSIYIEDATGGIQVFGVDTANVKPVIGDVVQVVGTVSAFNQELEITSPIVTITGTGPAPAPQSVTGAQITALQFQGELVKAAEVTVQSVGNASSSGAYNVNVQDASGTTFVVRVVGNGIGIPNSFWQVGGVYDVTGILVRFNSTAELEPRSAADVTAFVPPATIASARANNPADSVLVTVEGTVVAGLGTFNGRSIYIEDATGGIQVFGVDTASIKPQLGDKVRVTGKVVAFNQELEIVSPVISLVSSGAAPAPITVTGAQITALQFQGQLVTAPSLTVVSVGNASSSGGYNVTVKDAAGTQFTVRVANNGIGVPTSFWHVGSTYDVTGILIRFNTTAELEPRSAADVIAR